MSPRAARVTLALLAALGLLGSCFVRVHAHVDIGLGHHPLLISVLAAWLVLFVGIFCLWLLLCRAFLD